MNERSLTVCNNIPMDDCMMELVSQLQETMDHGWSVRIQIMRPFINIDVYTHETEVFSHTVSDVDELMALMMEYVEMFEEMRE